MIIKAAGGGGGRGMRVVHTEAALLHAVQTTKAEAGSAFNNPAVYMEKFLQNPRHIEIQVLADRTATRSTWRARLLDAAPSPEGDRGSAGAGIPRRLIDKIGERRASACKKIGYRGAGTFEFLYENGEFYFIEMNTRVQVEHPVTEAITGIDIVRTQILVAAGEKLPFTQRQIQLRGHAIECRVNAEDPSVHPVAGTRHDLAHAGRPGRAGRLACLCQPPGAAQLRLDDRQDHRARRHREQALARMRTALSEVAVEGIKTNVPLHRELMVDASFEAGGTNIHYLEHWLEQHKR